MMPKGYYSEAPDLAKHATTPTLPFAWRAPQSPKHEVYLVRDADTAMLSRDPRMTKTWPEPTSLSRFTGSRYQ